jgi:tripartite-type tricarboxylate transporter receptor subunit TctC
MHVQLRLDVAAIVLACHFCAGAAIAQGYPNKPVRLIAPEPGANGDLVARLIAQGIAPTLTQPVIVDNRPSNLIGEVVGKAPADGYTLGLGAGAIWLTSLLQKTSYDPIKDFTAITLVAATPLALVVHPSLPAHSVAELIALAKARPGSLNYGSGPSGGESNLGMALFKSMAKADIVRVPFRGAAGAVNALLVGEVQVMTAPLPTAISGVKNGKLRALGVTSLTPSLLARGLPALAGSGLPGFETVSIFGVLGPAGMSAANVATLNQEIVRYLARPEIREKFVSLGTEPVTSTPDQFAEKIKSEMAKWGKVVRDAHLTAD